MNTIQNSQVNWVNILVHEETKSYMLVTDDEIGDGDTYILDSLYNDGWERFADFAKSHRQAKHFMSEFYPAYKRAEKTLVPISFKTACDFVNQFHRHHISPQGCKFVVAVSLAGHLVGVAIAGRPVSRHCDDGSTVEVTRLCVKSGYRGNICSFLYSKVCAIASAMGYMKVITYTLAEENGSSLKASGFEVEALSSGGSWNSNSRPRTDKHPTGEKLRWVRNLT